MNRDIEYEGLPLADRCKLWVANALLARLSPMGRIRLRWHLLREKAG